METELEPGVKPLPYKIKGMSRESPSQRALHVVDTDLRSHWSTGTNTKEWILLELEEPCLLSHIRIYNKSVLEWEIAAGLRYKPESFVKVRPRCEAPRRDMLYSTSYTPCRYVRISCLRGSPIAIYFIQLVGVSILGLEPEFQPVVNHLLPHIISHKLDAHNMHLQLLQDVTNRLSPFLSQLEADLLNFSESDETTIRFFATLAGPFYPILYILNERCTGNIPDSDSLKNNQASTLTVSSNFEMQPRRARSPSPFLQPAGSCIAFRPDAVFLLLRKAFQDSHLGNACRIACRALMKLSDSVTTEVSSISFGDSASSSVPDEIINADTSCRVHLTDYSSLFGEEFRIPDDNWDASFLSILDVGAIEEGILHVLYACASQPLVCCKLAESASNIWSALPLVQALLPALRPSVINLDQFDDSFSQWKQPYVQRALSQIAAASFSLVHRSLLQACTGYLSSYVPSHAKAACVLIDLCSGPLAPWISAVIAKVDLVIELLEDLLGTIQGACHSIARARAAVKYILLALSGHMDDLLAKYKEVKHRVLFLLEMLEPFLDPAINAVKNTIAFGDVSTVFLEKQEHNCDMALKIIRTAVQRPAVLPSLESEWRRGSVAPSILLSILGPQIALPPEIDLCKYSSNNKAFEEEYSTNTYGTLSGQYGISIKSNIHEESNIRSDLVEANLKGGMFEASSLLFAPPELKGLVLKHSNHIVEGNSLDKNAESSHSEANKEGRHVIEKNQCNQFQNGLILEVDFSVEYFNLQADYLQLVDYRDCELRASEFHRLSLELDSQHDASPEGHEAAVDALLLAAECYVNPFFMMGFHSTPKLINKAAKSDAKVPQEYDISNLSKVNTKNGNDLEMLAHLERKRDKTVLQLLLQAAELDWKYQRNTSEGEPVHCNAGENPKEIEISPSDVHVTDAVTLVRANQALLCRFLVKRLQRECSMHEILMQSLLFLLHSATELFCPPECIVDIIFGFAEYLNESLDSFYIQLKEGKVQLDPEKLHVFKRFWVLLLRLIVASSGTDDRADRGINFYSGYRYQTLIPFSSWMKRIPKFSSSQHPLVRFLGWMAISRYAKQYVKDHLFLTSDLLQLTCLLSIFGDDLAYVDNLGNQKSESLNLQHINSKDGNGVDKGFEHGDLSFHATYPQLNRFFPSMKKQFGTFCEIILEAVGLQLRSLPSSSIPDVLCWFSNVCLWPFSETDDLHLSANTTNHLKGFAAKNAKVIVIYTLEAIVAEHMESLLPEIPRVMHILASLCRSSYCDVFFLDSVLRLLKPLVSYALEKISDCEKQLTDSSSSLNFESLCFNEFFSSIKSKTECRNGPTEDVSGGALVIFVLGSLFPHLSSPRRIEVLQALLAWADFTNFEPTSSLHNYLCAFQTVIESCKFLLLNHLQKNGVLIPEQNPHFFEETYIVVNDTLSSFSCFQNDVPASVGSAPSDEKACGLSSEELEFLRGLDNLILNLYLTTDLCWKLHPQLAKKLTLALSECFIYSRCLLSINQSVTSSEYDGSDDCFNTLSDHFSRHWKNALKGLVESVVKLRTNHCWQVASVVLDHILELPHFCLEHVLCHICSVIKEFCSHAPRIEWRLQSDKWLSALFTRGIDELHGGGTLLVDLFCTMLGHPEPEQRSVALKHLSRIIRQDTNRDPEILHTIREKSILPEPVIIVPESIQSLLASSTWDMVASLALSDSSMLLRTLAMSLLIDFIPFAHRTQLQSFLGAADVLCGLGSLAYPVHDGPFARLSVALLVSACLHSPMEDIALIPDTVWRNMESLGISSVGRIGDVERKACQALCKLRSEGAEVKEVLKDVLSTNSSLKDGDPEFKSTRESILQIEDLFNANDLERTVNHCSLLHMRSLEWQKIRGQAWITRTYFCSSDIYNQ